MTTYDENERWKLFRGSNGKCVSCGTRLKWENYDVRGLSGGWLIDEGEEDRPEPAASMCFRCSDHPIAQKRRKFIIDEGV